MDHKMLARNGLDESGSSQGIAGTGILGVVFCKRFTVDFDGDARVRQAIGVHFVKYDGDSLGGRYWVREARCGVERRTQRERL